MLKKLRSKLRNLLLEFKLRQNREQLARIMIANSVAIVYSEIQEKFAKSAIDSVALLRKEDLKNAIRINEKLSETEKSALIDVLNSKPRYDVYG
jgi:hypothetical protein